MAGLDKLGFLFRTSRERKVRQEQLLNFNYSLTAPVIFHIFNAGNVDLISLLDATGIN